jgi:hypothetical protein
VDLVYPLEPDRTFLYRIPQADMDARAALDPEDPQPTALSKTKIRSLKRERVFVLDKCCGEIVVLLYL